jgi:Kef-type K+ transport system membrane component KefB
MLIGEVGLLLSIVEAGLLVKLDVLRLVGVRAFAVALLGTILVPLPVAFGVARLFKCGNREALACAICLLPSSSNVAVIYLRRNRLLNTPMGQLLVTATSIDDVIALVGISQLRALHAPSKQAFLEPLVGYGIAIVVGTVSLWVVPRVVTRIMVPYLPARLIPKGMLVFTAALAAALMSALDALECSYLLGAFLTGLSLCTLPTMHHIWGAQLKRLQTWLLRLFFASTVGFDVPIAKFGKPRVIGFAAALLLAVTGKALCGLLARPANARNILTVAFAYSTIGELGFVAAVVGYHETELLSTDTFAAVCLAIIVTNVLGPSLLRRTLAIYTRSVQSELTDALKQQQRSGALAASNPQPAPGDDAPAAVFYKLTLRCHGRWGLMGDVLRVLTHSGGCTILEFRTDAVGGDALYEAILKAGRPLPDAGAVQEHLQTLRSGLVELLAHDPDAAAMGHEHDAVDAASSVDIGTLRGLFLRPWNAARSLQSDDSPDPAPERPRGILSRRLSSAPTVRDVFAQLDPLRSAGSTRSAAVSEEMGDGIEASPPPSSRLNLARGVSVVPADVALARANAADLALATATAVSELERAQEAADEDEHGLLGLARTKRLAALVAPALAAASSAAEAALELVAAAAASAHAEVQSLEAQLSEQHAAAPEHVV